MTELTFLGTGTSQGVPMIGCRCGVCASSDRRDRRLRSSVLVTAENVDSYMGTQPALNFEDPLSWGIGPLVLDK